MKKIITLLLITAVAFSCSDNGPDIKTAGSGTGSPSGSRALGSPDGTFSQLNQTGTNSHEVTFGIPASYLTSKKIKRVLMYTNKDKEYTALTRELRKAAAESYALIDPIYKLAPPSTPPPGDDGGNGGPLIVVEGSNGVVQQFLQTSDLTYYSDIALTSTNHQGFTMQLFHSTTPNRPLYGYNSFDSHGVLLGSSIQPASVQRGWWGCTLFEFGQICGEAIHELICAAAGLVAPELVLVTFAACAISCVS